ncbi:MAG: tetratricopeptide repeat protein [Planctomycetota bacterium]
MAHQPPSHEDLIRIAFSRHRGDFYGFLSLLQNTIRTGLPERLLVAVKNLLNAETDPTRILWLRLATGYIHLRKRDLDSMSAEIKGMVDDESLPSQLRAHACYLYGRILLAESKIEEAMQCSEKAIALYDGDEDNIAILHFNILGSCNRQLNFYNEALKYYYMALEREKKIDPENIFSGTYNNIALVHMELGDISKALYAFKEALELEKRSRNPINIALALSNISGLFLSQGRIQEALDYSRKAFIKLQTVEDNYTRTVNFLSLGEIHLVLRNLYEALNYAKQGMLFAESSKDKMMQAEAKLLYGVILAELTIDAAEKQLKEALDFHEKEASGKTSVSLERALMAYGKLLCEKTDPEGYSFLVKAEEHLENRPKSPQVKTMLKDVRTIMSNLPPDLKPH